MIGKLKGIIDSIKTDYMLLDVAGVCYKIFCSAKTLSQLPESGNAATLHIETHVREDHIHLYGFTKEEELRWFNELIKVNGVGVKVALAILNVLNAAQISTAIAAQDKTAFTQVSGIGPKVATRILHELKDTHNLNADASFESTSPSVPDTATSHDITDAISALTNLGYNRSEAHSAVHKVANQNSAASLEHLIKDGLKELMK